MGKMGEKWEINLGEMGEIKIGYITMGEINFLVS